MQNTGKTILIIEDELPMLNILKDKLTESGFQTLEAKDGEAGLVLALAKHPDLILLDVLMPKLNGLALLNQLRMDSWGKEVPVIMLTNLDAQTDETIQSVMKNQPSYYLIKSNVKLTEVVDKIKEVLFPPEQTSESL